MSSSDHCRPEIVLPHSDHYCIETVAPSGDHYCIDIVLPSSDHCCTETYTHWSEGASAAYVGDSAIGWGERRCIG